MSSASDEPNDQTPDEPRVGRSKRPAEIGAQPRHPEPSTPQTPLRSRAKERLRSLKPTDIPSRPPGDDPQEALESA